MRGTVTVEKNKNKGSLRFIHLGNIPCDAVTNNCYFGREDMKTLLVAAKDGIYRITLNIPGLKIPLE